MDSNAISPDITSLILMTMLQNPPLSQKVLKDLFRLPERQVGCFFKIFKIRLFCCLITHLVKKLQLRSLYEVIEDIPPFALNTKLFLSDIWLLRYKQNRGHFVFKSN